MIKGKLEMHHALNNIQLIKDRTEGKKLAFFLDYDGTLSPIVAKPELAVLSQAMRACLEKLSKQHFVAIISGRQLKDVRERVGIKTLYYAGNHGLEVAGPNNYESKKELDKPYLELIESISQELKSRLQTIDNILIENKKFSLSVHFRLVDEMYINMIESAVDDVVDQHPILMKRHGKKVFEIYPDIAWDKGKAVLYLLKQCDLSLSHVLPFYLGDDVTDEDAFNALHNMGISVLISKERRESAADFFLLDDKEVIAFLNAFTK